MYQYTNEKSSSHTGRIARTRRDIYGDLCELDDGEGTSTGFWIVLCAIAGVAAIAILVMLP